MPMLHALRSRPSPSRTKASPPSLEDLKRKLQPPPPQEIEDRLAVAIERAEPKIVEAVQPLIELLHGVETTAPENKAIAEKVSAFSDKVRIMGAQLHPFTSYENLVEAWLGASPFNQSSETREVAPLLPGLKYKGVQEVVHQNYKVVHAVAAQGWQRQIVAPKFSRIQTDYDQFESIPTEVVYCLEDEKANRLVVELRREWSDEPPQLTVLAHNDQPELVSAFYQKMDDWVAENNFYKNKVLHYVEPPFEPPYMDFQGGLKTKPTTWDDIALPEKSTELIRENTVDFLENLEVYKENGKFANRNLLMAGPPGTGKSMVNDILISELKDEATFIYVTSKSIKTSASVSGIFSAARMLGPTVVLMEDLDLVGSTDRNDNARRDILNELLNQLSGIYDNSGLVVVGSTNQASAFDRAMLRPLRFSTIIPMPLPDRDLREVILTRVTAKTALADDIDLGALADQTEDFSGAGLTELKEMAVQAAIEDGSLDPEGMAIVGAGHFDHALELIRLKKDYMDQLRREEEEGGISRPPAPLPQALPQPDGSQTLAQYLGGS